MREAKALSIGDTIGIAAPASPFDRGLFQRGVKAIEAMGFGVLHRKDIFDQNRYFAGTEKRRAEEFMELVADDSVKAIMFARGGYGSQRVIPHLDAAAISAKPKPIVGFSDLTALLTFLRQSAGMPTFYGPVITQLGAEPAPLTCESLARALTTKGGLGDLPAGHARTMKPGRAQGRLVGGCLTLINSSIGTPYALDTKDAILFIEDTGEKIYVLDRMLTQLKNSGSLASVKGIVIGAISPPSGEKHDVDAMFADVLAGFDGPVVDGFPAGHTGEFVTLPLGAEALLDAPSDGSAPALSVREGFLR